MAPPASARKAALGPASLWRLLSKGGAVVESASSRLNQQTEQRSRFSPKRSRGTSSNPNSGPRVRRTLRHSLAGLLQSSFPITLRPVRFRGLAVASDDLKTNLAAFTVFASSLSGDEKSEAQSFLDHFFRALGHAGAIEAGATFEFRVAKKPGSAQLN